MGCRFAIVAAARPARYQQVVEALDPSGNPKRVASAIAARVSSHLANSSIQAAALVFTEPTPIRRAAEILLALGGEAKWSIDCNALTHPHEGDMVALHVTRSIPFGATECPSEALVFGPYAQFPMTRRAPVTALEMFVGTPLEFDPGSGRPTVAAQLAHMRMEFETAEAFQTLWAKTRSGRLAALGGVDDNRAKAKVSFVMPLRLATELGCVP